MPLNKNLSIFQTSGQLVDAETVVSRDALLSPVEGFVVRTKVAQRKKAKTGAITAGPPVPT